MESEMTGGCISVWLRKVPDAKDMNLLKEYSKRVVPRIEGWFGISFKIPRKGWIAKLQILLKIGYVPKFEIEICGGTDCIFLAAEAILRKFKGITTCGVPLEEFDRKSIRGKYHYYYSISFEFYRPYISRGILVDVELFSVYFNSRESEETKRLYSFPDE